MRPRLLRLALVLCLAALLLATAFPAAAGSGVGAILNLGRTNTVDAVTALVGATTSRILQLTNRGTGSALSLTVTPGVAPLRVNSTGLVRNLNADRLDGLDASAFMSASARPDAETLDGIDSAGFVQAGTAIDAATLDGLDSSDFMRSTGTYLLTIGHGGWHKFNYADATYPSSITGANATWSSSSAAAYYLGVEAQLPAILNGKALSLTGLQLCYGASSSASLAYVEVNAIDATSGLGTTTTLGSDASLRTDTACRTYSLAQPHTLAYSEGVGVVIAVNWTSPNTLFRISRTSLILRTTTTDSSLP